MVHAFIMIKTASGQSEELLQDIRIMERVSDAHIVAGNYDIIAEVDTSEVYEILKTVSSEIQSLDGIAETRTYIALD